MTSDLDIYCITGGIDMSQETTVTVWDKPYKVRVYQRSKTVWIAEAEYMGELLSAKGTSKGTAAKRWQEKARYKGNP